MAPVKPPPVKPPPTKRPIALTADEHAELSKLLDDVGIAEACRRRGMSRSMYLGAVATRTMTAAGYALAFGSRKRGEMTSPSLAQLNRVGGRF